MPGINYAPRYGVMPTAWIEDSDENWTQLLSHPPVGTKEGSCIRGTIFKPNSAAPTTLNVGSISSIILDIDEWGSGEPIYDPSQIAELLGRRCILWTTYNSTKETPRYRLVIPLAHQVAPDRYKDLFTKVNKTLEEVASEKQSDLVRLGYLPRLPSESRRPDYYFKIFKGPLLDPEKDYGPLVSTPSSFGTYEPSLNLGEPDQEGWLPEAERLKSALTYFKNVGDDVLPGGRHAELFKIGCKCWWDFWLDREGVETVLMEVNSRFPTPKPSHEVRREVEASFSRTRGFTAVKQPEDWGSKVKIQKSLSKGEIRELARLLKRRSSEISRELGGHLKKLADEGNVSSSFERVSIFKRMARLLASEYPDHDPKSIAHQFAASLAESEARSPGAPDLLWIEKIVTERQSEQKKIKAQEERQSQEEISRRRKAAFGNCRSDPYTAEEIADFSFYQKCTPEEFANRWIIQHGNSYYIFVDGDYKAPVPKNMLFNAAFIDLSPHPQIEFYEVSNRDGPKRKDSTSLVQEYGRIARRAVVDLCAQQTFFDYTSETIYEAPCPLRTDLKPERIPEVEEWLESFGSEKLLDYISLITRLDIPMAALYLDGPRNSGKSLLAVGLSRLYSTDGITPLDEYYSSFNDGLTMNPILIGDEVIPDKLSGPKGSEELRKLVQSTNRLLKRKHLNSSTLKGAFRIILCANNDRLIPVGSFLTAEDSVAVAERFFYLKLTEGPAKVMRKLGREQCEKFITEDKIARHALYLRNTRDVNLNTRFLVSGGESSITQRLDYSGVRGEILHFLYNVICEDGKIPVDDIFPYIKDPSAPGVALGVNAGSMYKNWTMVMGTEVRCPDLSDISECLKGLTHSGTGVRIRHNGKNVRYRVLDTGKLISWARYMDFDEEAILEHLDAQSRKPKMAAKKGEA